MQSRKTILRRLLRCSRAAARSCGRVRDPDRFHGDVSDTSPIWRPSVRQLEPRIVLDASAILNPLGLLLISGSEDSDFVQIDVDENNALTLTDESGGSIAVAGHPGNDTDPLSLSDANVNSIRIELGGGDDTVRMPLVPALDVFVLGENGTDQTDILIGPSDNGANTGTVGSSPPASTPTDSTPTDSFLIVASENINLITNGGPGDFGSIDVQLSGAVTVSEQGSQPADSVQLIVDNRFSVIGQIQLADSLTFQGSGRVDLDEANLTVGRAGLQLSFDMPGGTVIVGDVIESLGSTLDALHVTEATSVTLGGDIVQLDGALDISNVFNSIQLRSDILSDSVSAQSDRSLSWSGEIIANRSISLQSDLVSGTADLTLQDADQNSAISIASDRQTTISSDATFNADVGQIQLTSRGGQLFASSSSLVSQRADDSILIEGFQRAVLGDIEAASGELDLGIPGMTLGSVEQGAGTQIFLNRLSANVDGDLILNNDNNHFASVIDTFVGGNLALASNATDLIIESFTSLGENVDIASAGAMTIGRLDAVGSTVRLTGETINATAASNGLNIEARQLFVEAIEGIGHTSALDLAGIQTVAVETVRGDIDLLISGPQQIEIQNATTGFGDISLAVTGLPDNTDAEILLTDVEANDGQVNITSGRSVVAESVAADSDLLIQTQGQDNSVLIGRVSGQTIQINATDAIDAVPNKAGMLTAETITLNAATGIGQAGPLQLHSLSSLQAITDKGSVSLDIFSSESVTVEQITTSNGDIRLNATGSDDPTNLLDLRQVSTSDGNIRIDADREVKASSVKTEGKQNEDQETPPSGLIEITTTGASSDILVGQLIADGEGDISLDSSDDILNIPDASLIHSDDLELIARNQSTTPDSNDAINVRVNVNDLVAEVTSTDNRGDLRVDSIGSINLASSDASANNRLLVNNGQLVVTARQADTITVVDNNLANDFELEAKGAGLRVELEAGTVVLQDNVRIGAGRFVEQVAVLEDNSDNNQHANDKPALRGSVSDLGVLSEYPLPVEQTDIRISTNTFQVGQDVELMTEQGIARRFGPRPNATDGPEIDSTNQPFAFFDPDPEAINVDVLTQALENDATGILSINIGDPGERGLSIIVDWGDSDERRFQQIDDLSADDSLLVTIDGSASGQPNDVVASGQNDGIVSLTHLYTQNDILNSTTNGRTATDPFTVRFAVRHHESIVVTGLSEGESATVVQDGFTNRDVEGDLFSSSVDPSTTLGSNRPLIESATTEFIIPNLSIPVAFFPVRDVIPESTTPEVIVSSVEIPDFESIELSTSQGGTSSIAGRDEYFQIRALSPDPSAQDLAPPLRLPNDILDGDSLKQLMAELPDGTYEIEYVVGEGNERLILRIDVRDGAPTIQGNDLEEGTLRLRLIEPADSPESDSSNQAAATSLGAVSVAANVAMRRRKQLLQRAAQANQGIRSRIDRLRRSNRG